MPVLTVNQTIPNLQPGPIWTSFEQFRTQGRMGLGSLVSGQVATLQTKTGQYRIIKEQDFQQLYGLARDVERLRGGFSCMINAIKVVQKHKDSESIESLISVVNMIGGVPELPTRSDFETLTPEGFELDPEDEVDLDLAKIVRPLG